jgi:aldehyde:ferredoxin oxidoreductase
LIYQVGTLRGWKLTQEYRALSGGLGTNAKILWDRVPPEVEPFSPENLLIFSAGLLCGTPAPGANRTIVSTISPQTLLMAYSMMGGFFAPELKYAGYDKVIFAASPQTGLFVDKQRQSGNT